MHSFLRAIGFSNIRNRKTLEPIYKEILRVPTKNSISNISADTRLIQFDKDFGDGFGISIIGEMAIDGSISIEHYFPYVKSDQITIQDRIYVERHGDKEAYAGVSEDYNLGMTLIFYVQNISDYAKSEWMNSSNHFINRAYLSGLSLNGKIILDVNKDSNTNMLNGIPANNRSKLIEAARQGDKSALESLTLEDMDTYSIIGKRTKHEDILSIVETTFMPYGIETEHYSIIGNILSCELKKNKYTGEEIYIMTLCANDLYLCLAINKKDLIGEPAPGRRFKGELWLQGKLVI